MTDNLTWDEYFRDRMTPEPMSGCFLWENAEHHFGYGQVWENVVGERLAHRISWTLENGRIPKGLCVLHRCDVPACVNPSHLFLGTHADNATDKVAKGRQYHPKKKLTPSDIIKIREALDNGESSQRDIAKKFEVTQPVISRIGSRAIWAHIRKVGA